MAYTYYKVASFSGGLHSGEIGVDVVSQNIAGNYSVVNLDFSVRKDVASSSYNNGGANMYIAINGYTQVSSNSIDFRTYVIGAWNHNLQVLGVVLYHAPDGTMSVTIQAYCATGVAAGTYNQSQVITLPQIARKSTASVTPTVEVNNTNQVAVAITRADASFTHKVTFSIGGYSQEYTGVGTSQAFAIPLAWLNSIPNAVSGVANVRLETFSGATSLGYNDYGFTITVPSTIIPIVTDIAFARDTTGTDPFTSYAKGISKVSVSGVTVTNQYSATTALFKTYLHLASAAFTSGILYNGSSFITAVVPSAGTMRLTTVVTDSRGRESVAYYEDFTVYDYFAPILTVSAFRCNASGVPDPAGEYLSATMEVNVAPVNNNNTHVYTFEYKKTTDSTWTSISTAALTGYSGSLNAVRAASSANTWEVRATITDKVNTIPKATAVATKKVGFNYWQAINAAAIGKMAETADLFEVDLATKFNKAVQIEGILTAPAATPTVAGLMSPTDKTDHNAMVTKFNTPTYAKLMGTIAAFQALNGSATTFTKWNTSNGAGGYGTSLVASPSAGTITCNFDGYIQTAANMMFYGCTVGDAIIINVVIGGTTVYVYYLNAPSAGYFTISIPAMIFPVTNGQTVLLTVQNVTAVRGNAGNNNAYANFGCAFTVLKV